ALAEDGPGHVDALRGHELRRVVELQVGGREAELAAAPVAAHDGAADAVRPPEALGGGQDVAFRDRAADARRADRRAARLHRPDDLDIEAEPLAGRPQRRDVALPALPEPVVVADHEVAQAEAADEDLLDEPIRLVGG